MIMKRLPILNRTLSISLLLVDFLKKMKFLKLIRRHADLFWAVLACTGTFTVFLPALSCGFVDWDDGEYLFTNPYLHALSWHNVFGIFSDFRSDFYMPLTYLTYAIERHFFGWDPFYFHATNLAFHVANVVLVFWLIRCLGAKPEAAAIVSALFGVHPLHVESVVWVMERKDVLFAFFFLWGLVLYLRKPVNRSTRSIVLILFFLALLAKPTAVTLPLVLVLCDVCRGGSFRKSVVDKIPLFLLVAAWITITAFFKPSLLPQAKYGIGMPSAILYLADGILFYVSKLIVPAKLCILYSLKGKYFFHTQTWVIMASTLAIAGFFIFWAKRRVAAAWGVSFFLITLLPALVLVLSVRTVADRNMYLPSIGLFYAVADAALFYASRFKRLRPFAAASFALVLMAFSYMTWQRCQVWSDSQRLWTDVANKYPRSKFAHLQKGNAYMGAKKNAEAILEFRKALRIPGTSEHQASIYNALGAIRSEANVYTVAERLYRKSLSLNPAYAMGFNNLGNNYENQGKGKEAFGMYRAALEINPRFGLAYFNLADWYLRRGYFNEAIALYQKGMEYSPPDKMVYLGLAHAYSRIGRSGEAEAALSKAGTLKENP